LRLRVAGTEEKGADEESQAGNQDIWWMSVKSSALIKGQDFSAR
jgi:hypothetical protein